MNKKEKFYYQAQKLFDNQVLREIYVTENISLCNVGNAYYAAFLLGDIYKGNNVEFLLILGEELEFVLQKEENVSRLYHQRPPTQKMLYKFDERACNTMTNSRNRVLREGPEVDLENESRLIEKYCSSRKYK